MLEVGAKLPQVGGRSYMLNALKRGTLDCLYIFAGGQGSASITMRTQRKNRTTA